MHMTVTVDGLKGLRERFDRLNSADGRKVYAKALNDVGFQLKRDMVAEMDSVFANVSPWITRNVKVFAATADKLTVSVLPTAADTRGAVGRGGKMGVDPQKILAAQAWGGGRRDKKSEVLLRRAGLLPAGYQTAIPREPFPGSTDARGDISGKFMQHLLSYLQTHQSGRGYSGNMGKAARERVHKYGTSKINKKAADLAGPHMGRRYFVAGRHTISTIEGGEHVLRSAARKGTRHLQPGIWAAMGVRTVRPVLIFVRTPTYAPRLSMERIAKRTDRVEYFQRRVRYHIHKLLEQ